MNAGCAGKTVRSIENACHTQAPYRTVSPRQGTIQIHVYLYRLSCREFRVAIHDPLLLADNVRPCVTGADVVGRPRHMTRHHSRPTLTKSKAWLVNRQAADKSNKDRHCRPSD